MLLNIRKLQRCVDMQSAPPVLIDVRVQYRNLCSISHRVRPLLDLMGTASLSLTNLVPTNYFIIQTTLMEQ